MSKFPGPKFFATDKDVHDLLTKLNAESLLQIAKSRGLLLSHNSPKDSVVTYLSRQMFSHPQLLEALKLMEREDKEEKATPSKVDADVDIATVAQAFETVRDNRKDSDERMQITQRPSGELEVKVAYTHLDFSLATLRQRTTRELTFLVKKSGKILDFSYNNNTKAAELYSEVKSVLKGEDPNQITECVSLKGIPEVAKRIQFFFDLMNGIVGFRLRVVRDVKAERMSGFKPEPGDSDAESKEQMEDMVKKIALAGGSVWTSPEFRNMIKNGFYVYNAKWLGTQIEGENRTIEFDAGFSTGECLDFSVRVLGVYKRNESGDLEKKLTPLDATERESLRSLVQSTAFEAIEKSKTSTTIDVPIENTKSAESQ
jgi:hypothetical protein